MGELVVLVEEVANAAGRGCRPSRPALDFAECVLAATAPPASGAVGEEGVRGRPCRGGGRVEDASRQ